MLTVPRAVRAALAVAVAAAWLLVSAMSAQAASGSQIMNQAAAYIAANGGYVYVAPDAETQPTQAEIDALNAQIQAGPHPVYVAFVNARIKNELPGGDVNLMDDEFAEAVGLSGIYAVAAGPTADGKQAFRAASTTDYPLDPAPIATDAYNASIDDGLLAVVNSFVSQVEGDASSGGFWKVLLGMVVVFLVLVVAIGWFMNRPRRSRYDTYTNPTYSRPAAPAWGDPGTSTVDNHGTEEPRTGHLYTHVDDTSDPGSQPHPDVFLAPAPPMDAYPGRTPTGFDGFTDYPHPTRYTSQDPAPSRTTWRERRTTRREERRTPPASPTPAPQPAPARPTRPSGGGGGLGSFGSLFTGGSSRRSSGGSSNSSSSRRSSSRRSGGGSRKSGGGGGL